MLWTPDPRQAAVQPRFALPQIQMSPDPFVNTVVHFNWRPTLRTRKARIAAKVDMHMHGFTSGVDVDAGDVPRLGKFEEGLEGGGVVHPDRLTLTLRTSTSIPHNYRKNP
jgi:hypothetical protein